MYRKEFQLMNKNEEAMFTKLKRSTTEVLLLSLLSQQDMYGYQLTAEMKKQSNGLCNYNETTFYPILNRLLTQEMISMTRMITDQQRVRVYYHLETSGKEYFEDLKKACRLYMNTVDRILSLSEENNNESNK